MTSHRLTAPHFNTGWPQVQRAWQIWRMRRVTAAAKRHSAVQAAATAFSLSPGLIASVLADEQVRQDGLDWLQDRLVRLGTALPPHGSATLFRALERLCQRSVQSFSLGPAQMKPATLVRLGELGYLDVPPRPDQQRALLLDSAQAPRLVAACLRATADHWAAQGVDLSARPAILGTLYSLGLTGSRGVHAHPQASARGELIAEHAAWLDAQVRPPVPRQVSGRQTGSTS